MVECLISVQEVVGSNPRAGRFFFLSIQYLFVYTFLKHDFQPIVSWHANHVLTLDFSEIKRPSSGNPRVVVANQYVLLFVLYRAMKALVYGRITEKLSDIPVKTTDGDLWGNWKQWKWKPETESGNGKQKWSNHHVYPRVKFLFSGHPLKTTFLQRPPPYKDHIVIGSQRWLRHSDLIIRSLHGHLL